MKKTLLFLVLTGSTVLYAQNTESLNSNFVNASITDNAVFFSNSQSGTPGYEVPAGSGANTIYAAALWVGGLDVNGQIHVSGATFTPNGWSSGPIADPMNYTSVSYQTQYASSIWKVTRQEVLDHQAQYQQSGYTPVSSIADWPGNGDVSLGVADQLAPFVDNDGDGIYEPMDGDYPNFPGDEVVYVIVNDEANISQTYLGVEMHMMFYQFNDNGYMGETTFLNTRVFNRSTTNYYHFRQSIYADFDIGNYSDDYIGCDSSRNMMYGYNGDALDETNGGSQGYGQNPPCQAVMSLNRDLFSMTYYTNGAAFPTSDPNSDIEFWNYMNGFWADGSPMYYGGNAYNSGGVTTTPTHFVFSGNPYQGTGWTEANANNGSPNPPEDRRGVMTNAAGDLPAGSMVCSDFAFIFDDDDGNLENVQNVMNISDALQILYDSSPSSFPCGLFMANTDELEQIAVDIFPNPSKGDVTIKLDQSTGPVIIEVRDMTGRLVHSEITQTVATHIHLNVPEGMYQLSVQSAHSKVAKNLIIH